MDAAPDGGGDLRRHLDGGRPGRRRQVRTVPAGRSGGVHCGGVADGGWKYLSTGAWTDDLDEVTQRAKEIIYF